MAEITHRSFSTNGIRMHIAEAGSGPLVVLCHGFPESWYSWRHQLRTLSDAGYHVVAPAMRGYGRTSQPYEIEAYARSALVGDMVGLVGALGESRAVIVGHDHGSPVAWSAALMRPDIFYAVGSLSVPYTGARSPVRPSDNLRRAAGERFHYTWYFQEPGVAEAEAERDIRRWLNGFYHTLSGDMATDRFRWNNLPAGSILSDCFDYWDHQPDWFTDDDLDFYTGEFERTGLRGGLNWYRTTDHNWEQLAAYEGATMPVPAMFVTGEHDVVNTMVDYSRESLERWVPDLRAYEVLEGSGHWIQQERPEHVTRVLTDFLKAVT